MGVELLQSTPLQKEHLQKFIDALINAGESLPEIMVQPEGLEDEDKFAEVSTATSADPLLAFFRSRAALPRPLFLAELRSQRGAPAEAAAPA
jgi:hypothetical protein